MWRACRDGEKLVETFERALFSQATRPARLAWRLAELRGPGRWGCSAVGELLGTWKGGKPVRSELERRTLRVMVDAGFPEPERQYEVIDGVFIAYLGFGYPEEHKGGHRVRRGRHPRP